MFEKRRCCQSQKLGDRNSDSSDLATSIGSGYVFHDCVIVDFENKFVLQKCQGNVIFARARSWDIEILIPLIFLRRLGVVMYFRIV